MSDFNPDMLDAAKVGGGGAVATLMTLIAGRLFGSQDKVLARLDVLQATVSSLTEKFAVLVATSEHRDTAVEDLKRDMASTHAIVTDQGKQLARLDALVSKLAGNK